MIKYGLGVIGYLESYELKLNEKVGFDRILKSSNLDRESYFNFVTEDFKKNVLMEDFFSNFGILKKRMFNNLKSKLEKKVIQENNTIYIPIEEIVDNINLTISLEIDNLKDLTSQNKNEIKKFSFISENRFSEEKETSTSDCTYSESEIIEGFKRVTSKYTNNYEIKNNYFTITFD